VFKKEAMEEADREEEGFLLVGLILILSSF